MSEIKTLTIDELTAIFTKYPSDTKIFISSDEEGNGYGTIAADSIEHASADGALILYPAQERLEYDEILPKQWEQESEE